MSVLTLLLVVLAQDAGPALNADYAWGQQYHRDGTTPVVITVDNPGPAISGELVLRWGLLPMFQNRKNPTLESLEGATGPIWTLPVDLPQKSRRRYFAYVRAPEFANYSAWVFLRSGSRTLARFGVQGLLFADQAPVVGVVGTSLVHGLRAAGAQTGICRAAEIPDRWQGYANLHSVLWTDGDGAETGDAGQVDALKQWILMGGHLVIARASTPGLTGTFLEELAPVRFKGAARVTDWSALGDFAGAATNPRIDFSERRDGDAALEVTPNGGEVLVRTGSLPLVVQRPYGRGRITFLTYDPAGATFRDWEGAGLFWTTLLDLPPPAPEDDDVRREGPGVENRDFIQILARHEGIPAPSLGWAFLMICLYVAIVGPLDYFVLRAIGRTQLTWITFPASVALFSAIMLIAGSSRIAGRPTISETVVVDSMPEAGWTRGWAIASVFSPHRESLTLTVHKPEATLNAFITLAQQDVGPARLTEGAVGPWPFEPGATGIAIARWAEKGAPLRGRWTGHQEITIDNQTGRPLAGGWFIRASKVHALADIPEGRSIHRLGAPRTESPHGEGFPPSTLQPLVRQMVLEITQGIQRTQRFSGGYWHKARPNRPLPASHEMNMARWIEDGDSVLVAWAQAGGILELRGETTPPKAQTIYRVRVIRE